MSNLSCSDRLVSPSGRPDPGRLGVRGPTDPGRPMEGDAAAGRAGIRAPPGRGWHARRPGRISRRTPDGPRPPRREWSAGFGQRDPDVARAIPVVRTVGRRRRRAGSGIGPGRPAGHAGPRRFDTDDRPRRTGPHLGPRIRRGRTRPQSRSNGHRTRSPTRGHPGSFVLRTSDPASGGDEQLLDAAELVHQGIPSSAVIEGLFRDGVDPTPDRIGGQDAALIAGNPFAMGQPEGDSADRIRNPIRRMSVLGNPSIHHRQKTSIHHLAHQTTTAPYHYDVTPLHASDQLGRCSGSIWIVGCRPSRTNSSHISDRIASASSGVVTIESWIVATKVRGS
jgi:hypothetical protein